MLRKIIHNSRTCRSNPYDNDKELLLPNILAKKARAVNYFRKARGPEKVAEAASACVRADNLFLIFLLLFSSRKKVRSPIETKIYILI